MPDDGIVALTYREWEVLRDALTAYAKRRSYNYGQGNAREEINVANECIARDLLDRLRYPPGVARSA